MLKEIIFFNIFENPQEALESIIKLSYNKKKDHR